MVGFPSRNVICAATNFVLLHSLFSRRVKLLAFGDPGVEPFTGFRALAWRRSGGRALRVGRRLTRPLTGTGVSHLRPVPEASGGLAQTVLPLGVVFRPGSLTKQGLPSREDAAFQGSLLPRFLLPLWREDRPLPFLLL